MTVVSSTQAWRGSLLQMLNCVGSVDSWGSQKTQHPSNNAITENDWKSGLVMTVITESLQHRHVLLSSAVEFLWGTFFLASYRITFDISLICYCSLVLSLGNVWDTVMRTRWAVRRVSVLETFWVCFLPGIQIQTRRWDVCWWSLVTDWIIIRNLSHLHVWSYNDVIVYFIIQLLFKNNFHLSCWSLNT